MPVEAIKLANIKVKGVVQGVGFRPFVYRLAHDNHLKGWVRNTSGSVEIEAEGSERALHKFLINLQDNAPPMSHIEDITVLYSPAKGYTGFQILESVKLDGKYQLVSPDIATCDDCRHEIFTPSDRRFRYPFTNCTNCGPRFTIIEDIPYDRPLTTMRSFKMCPQCQREYDNPADRRFHAQPNACPLCGPQLSLVDGSDTLVKTGDIIGKAAELLLSGNILAIRGLGGFQLACDATDENAIKILRERKRRPSKPLAVMFASIAEIRKHCMVLTSEVKLFKSRECPIVLVRWKKDLSAISPLIAPNNKYLGVMLPYTPLHHLLTKTAGIPLVMTSGNLSEEPIAKDNDEALIRLKGIADYFLLHDREIYARYDDSVYMITDAKPQPVRRARGYAPYPITLPFQSRQILACGAEEKNTFCLTRDGHAFISQHIGDMENAETLEHFENTIALYQKLFRIQPEIVAYDMHPEYLASKYALEMGEKQGLILVPVQHHHAHVVSCLVENNVAGPVIGVACDGTGYGSDGAIWGGEFLIVDYKTMQRAGHLEYVPMPGGALAIKKPYRMALSYIYTLLGEDYFLEGLPLNQVDAIEQQLIRQQIRQKINSPLTSSMGRLFDAVAAIAGVRSTIDYDAQAAIELEMAAAEDKRLVKRTYPFRIASHEGVKIIQLKELLRAVIDDVRTGVPVSKISLKFHKTVAVMIIEMCRLLADETGIKEVALSGGVFQNRLLSGLVTSMLRKQGLKVYLHHLLPCNDGCISLGQVVIANKVAEA